MTQTGEEYMCDVIEMMMNMKNEDGERVFPHLNADCADSMATMLEEMAAVMRADPISYGPMGMLEACTRAYWAVVRGGHPNIH